MALRLIKGEKGGISPFFLFLTLSLLLGMVMFASLFFGSVDMDMESVAEILKSALDGGAVEDRNAWNIVMRIRLPRIVLTALAGAVLSIVGILMQTITRNPLAEPFVLGVSSFFQAVTTLIVYSAKNESQSRSAMFWLVGSFSGADWKDTKGALAVLILLLLFCLVIGKELDLLLLGQNAAAQTGLNVKRLQFTVVCIGFSGSGRDSCRVRCDWLCGFGSPCHAQICGCTSSGFDCGFRPWGSGLSVSGGYDCPYRICASGGAYRDYDILCGRAHISIYHKEDIP